LKRPNFFWEGDSTFITLFPFCSLYCIKFLRVVSRRGSTKKEKE
jgi:hypothetical protein